MGLTEGKMRMQEKERKNSKPTSPPPSPKSRDRRCFCGGRVFIPLTQVDIGVFYILVCKNCGLLYHGEYMNRR